MSEMKGQLLAGSKLDEPVSGVSSLEVCVDERHRFFLVAWHEVPIEIEGRLDRRVTQMRRDRLRVHAGCDQETREGVPAFV